jgi:hypothetical protein
MARLFHLAMVLLVVLPVLFWRHGGEDDKA